MAFPFKKADIFSFEYRHDKYRILLAKWQENRLYNQGKSIYFFSILKDNNKNRNFPERFLMLP